MQRPDEKKRREIMEAAARLFGARPFHAVKLDDVAAEARIGKGTVYVYFDSKEELYASVVEHGFVRLVDGLRGKLAGAGSGAWEPIRVVVEEVVRFAFRFPDLFSVMPGTGVASQHAALRRTRSECVSLIASIIRRGVEGGELEDTYPELTANYMLAFVRAGVLYGPEGLTEGGLRDHMLTVLRRGIAAGREGR